MSDPTYYIFTPIGGYMGTFPSGFPSLEEVAKEEEAVAGTVCKHCGAHERHAKFLRMALICGLCDRPMGGL